MACVICFLSSANMNLVVISLNHCDTDIGDTCNLLLQSLQNDCVTTCSSIFNFTACRSVNTFLNCLSDCISQFSSSQIVESRVNVLFFFNDRTAISMKFQTTTIGYNNSITLSRSMQLKISMWDKYFFTSAKTSCCDMDDKLRAL